MLKKFKIPFFIISIILIIAIVSAGSFLHLKNQRYTSGLNGYNYFVPTFKNKYYIELHNEISVKVYDLFKLFPLSLSAQTEITLHNVYWENADTYINISLNVQENINGGFKYYIHYEDNPYFVKTSDGKSSSSYIKYNETFLLSDVVASENSQFIEDNSDSVTALIKLADDYWNLNIYNQFVNGEWL